MAIYTALFFKNIIMKNTEQWKKWLCMLVIKVKWIGQFFPKKTTTKNTPIV